jgi:hypothetical protein
MGSYRAQFVAAEKDDEGMAQKIFMGVRPFPKVETKTFDIAEMETLSVRG